MTLEKAWKDPFSKLCLYRLVGIEMPDVLSSCWDLKKKTLICVSPVFIIFPGGWDGQESAYNAGDSGPIPGSGRSPGEGNGNPLQYFCLENPMDRGAWQATVYRVAKSPTRLIDFHLQSWWSLGWGRGTEIARPGDFRGVPSNSTFAWWPWKKHFHSPPSGPALDPWLLWKTSLWRSQ